MRGRARRSAATPLVAVLLVAGSFGALAALAHDAEARPGGGQSFGAGGGGGGGSHPGGGGGHSAPHGNRGGKASGAALAVVLLGLWSTAVLGLTIAVVLSKSKNRYWMAASMAHAPIAGGDGALTRPKKSGRAALESLLVDRDPDFSSIVFEDFVYALYAELQTARGAHRLETLGVWIAPGVLQEMAAETPGLHAVNTVVIGSLRHVSASILYARAAVVTVEIEANYTEVVRGEASPATPYRAAPVTSTCEATYYVRQRLSFQRALDVRSKPPELVRLFRCPSCGAPREASKQGPEPTTCAHCNKPVGGGAFDWLITSSRVLEKTARPPQLVGTIEERGTDRPTVVDPDAYQRFAAITARDPSTTWPRFEGLVHVAWTTLQADWTMRDLTRARPFMSDALWQMQTYWLESYRRQGLVNECRNRITRIVGARVASDRYYDAITVRIFASGVDYTTDERGRIVGGSSAQERAFSEYWTFIRGTSATHPTEQDRRCPACGAALSINMAGACGHCQAKVASGRFDWVLSRIEQDDTYVG